MRGTPTLGARAPDEGETVDEGDDQLTDLWDEAERTLASMLWTVFIAGDVWEQVGSSAAIDLAAKVQMQRPIIGYDGDQLRIVVAPRDVKLVAQWPPGVAAAVKARVDSVVTERVAQATRFLLREDLDRPDEG